MRTVTRGVGLGPRVQIRQNIATMSGTTTQGASFGARSAAAPEVGPISLLPPRPRADFPRPFRLCRRAPSRLGGAGIAVHIATKADWRNTGCGPTFDLREYIPASRGRRFR